METCGGDAGIIDVDKTTETLEPEKMSSGGLCLPGKDRVEFRPPERKSLLGLDVLAIAKRAESVADGGFKAPRERVAFVLASLEEEENFESFGLDEVGSNGNNGRSNHASRKYRESNASKVGSIVTQEEQVNDTPQSHHSSETMSSDASNTPIRSHQNYLSTSPLYDRDNRDIERKDYRDNSRSERRRMSHRHSVDKENYHRREARGRHDQDHDGEHGRKRSRYEGSRRTPGRSDWDDGRWEWEDTPRRDSHSHTSRRHQPSPSPMLVGASPDGVPLGMTPSNMVMVPIRGDV